MQYSIAELPEVFSDLEPVQVRDDEGVAAIAYSEAFQIAFGYWRAALKLDERSERTLKLTAACLKLNSANYTVWHFRRLCLDAVYHPDDKAAAVAATLGGDNPKNYQIWYHRRALLEKVYAADPLLFQDYARAELDYIAAVLQEDGKNYHAWSHRQWVVVTRNSTELWESELKFAESLITIDRRNNSAWNHRWFVVHRSKTGTVLDATTADAELEYVMTKSELVGDPNNESPWRYYIAVIKEQICNLQDGALVISLLNKARDQILTVREEIKPDVSPNLASALIDVLEWKREADSLREAISLAQSLADEHDVIRKRYWQFRTSQMQTALEKL